jgi:hypothetical protein
MVVRLPCPTTDDDSYIDSLVGQGQIGADATFFLTIKDGWKSRVQAYATLRGDPGLLKPWLANAAQKQALENLYSSQPPVHSVQKPILDALRIRDLQFCPACGEDGTPNTLDHYLPKNTYPEFSVTSRNLFPMCDICQGKKGSKTVNRTNQRLFVHPYFDDFTERSVVRLVIGRPFESPTSFSIEPHPALTAEQSTLISCHLEELGISARFDQFFKTEYTRLKKLVSRARAKGQDVRESIATFHEYALDKSTNSWGAIFYQGVLDDAELMTFLENGQLPPYL